MKFRAACVLAALLSFVPLTFAQTPTAQTPIAQTPATGASAMPRLVRFGGAVKDLNGSPLTGVVGITFALYSEQTGGAALWIETKNVTADSTGHYVALLGSTKPDGLPTELFTTEQARWVGVQVSGQEEQPRVLLVSAPYAFKAGDAETIGGLPPSAFMLAALVNGGGMNIGVNNDATATSPSAASSSAALPAGSSNVTTSGGTVNALPLFTTSTNIQNSILSQAGTTSVSVAGALKLPATGSATKTAGKNSQPENFVASSFDSSTSTAENQTFQWQAEPASNDTASPSGTLNLLYGLGATAPAETGLKLSSKGQFTFATGQTFPGTGTISGVTTASGSGLAGGGTSGTLNLSVPAAGITNTMLKDSTIILNASTAGGLTTPAAMSLGSTYTIGLKTCSANQILEYVGTAWACTTAATGTVTKIISGAGLAGGPITGSGTLSIPNDGVANAMLENSKITLNSGNGISAPGAMTLGDTYTLAIDTSVVPQLYNENSFGFTNWFTVNSSTLPALNVGNTGGADGIDISALGSNSYGINVSGGLYAVVGNGGDLGGYFYGPSGGSYSENDSENEGAVGAYAIELGEGNAPIGSWGYSQSENGGIGVYGQAVDASTTGLPYEFYGVGIWGDTGTEVGIGVAASSDNAWALAGFNNSDGLPTMYLQNFGSGGSGLVLQAVGSNGQCNSDVNGNLGCTGGVAAVAPVNGGSRQVALSAIHSAENWFEDAGSGQLSGGEAVVNIESLFGETINTGVEYHVFLTPNGDCKGLYVAQKSAGSFTVKELGGGASSIAFDYRIMAKRKGLEQIRLADRTQAFSLKNRPNRPVGAVGKRGPNAQDVRKRVQQHLKPRPVAALSKPASTRKQ